MKEVNFRENIMDRHSQDQSEAIHKAKADLLVSVSRHGPKDGLEGPLTEQGKNSIKNFYHTIYKDSINDKEISRKLISSPIRRAKQTAEIFNDVISDRFNIEKQDLEEDERLSEQNLVEYIHLLPAEKQADWFRYWYEGGERTLSHVFTGNEAVRNFSQWLLDQVEHQIRSGKRMEINAFSHGPVMAAFILRMEEKMGVEILTLTTDRLNYEKLFAEGGSEFMYLSNLRFYYFHADPDNISLYFRGKKINIPLSLLKHVARE